MFDYEKLAGQAYVKDRFKRLQSYEWMNTGIKFTIPDIDKKIDLGKYQGHVETEQEYSKITIEIKEIFGQSFMSIYKFFLRSKNVTNIYFFAECHLFEATNTICACFYYNLSPRYLISEGNAFISGPYHHISLQVSVYSYTHE